VPKQIHLDLATDDLEASVAQAIRPGAREASEQPEPDEWARDVGPGRHPFCLTTQVPPEAL